MGPVSCGLFASACSGCPFVSRVLRSLYFLCGFCLWCRGVPVALLFLLLSFPRLLCSAFGVWVASTWVALSLLRSPPCFARPRLVFWCLLVQSVFCWSLPLGIWLYLRRPSCHACGMVCCDGLAPVFTSLRPCVGLCPLHHVACAVPVLFLPALRFSPLSDPWSGLR